MCSYSRGRLCSRRQEVSGRPAGTCSITWGRARPTRSSRLESTHWLFCVTLRSKQEEAHFSCPLLESVRAQWRNPVALYYWTVDFITTLWELLIATTLCCLSAIAACRLCNQPRSVAAWCLHSLIKDMSFMLSQLFSPVTNRWMQVWKTVHTRIVCSYFCTSTIQSDAVWTLIVRWRPVKILCGGI